MGSRDFTYNLILKQDKESWAGGARSVDKLANNVSRLIGTAQAAAAAYAALKGVVEGSKLASESAMLSDSLGVSVKRLEDWKVAAKIAGVSSSELTKSMGALDRKFTEWKNRGKADTGMAVALGQLGLNASDMFDMSADERARVILQAASTMKDTKNAAALVSQLLGGAGEQMYHFMRLSNTSVDRLLERSRRFSLVDDGVAKNGFAFTTELNTTIAALQQLGTFAGATFGANFTDFLKNVNKFFSDNGTGIAKKITGFSNSLKTIGEALKPFAEGALKIAVSALFDLSDALAKLLNGDLEGAGDKVVQFLGKSAKALKEALLGKEKEDKVFLEGTQDKLDESASDSLKKGDVGGYLTKTLISGLLGLVVLPEKGIKALIGNSERSKLFDAKFASGELENAIMADLTAGWRKTRSKQSFADLSEDMQESVGEYVLRGGDVQKLSPFLKEADKLAEAAALFGAPKPKVQDGIMRPDGRVTQVAPDDWVFAARNIGDLAKMFIPQSASTTTYGGSSYTINQTLNIQGAPFAQAAKRAAYEGTSQALRALSDSSKRLQLMPGLR